MYVDAKELKWIVATIFGCGAIIGKLISDKLSDAIQ